MVEAVLVVRVMVAPGGDAAVSACVHATARGKATATLMTAEGERGSEKGVAWVLWLLLRGTMKGEKGLVEDEEGVEDRCCCCCCCCGGGLLAWRLP